MDSDGSEESSEEENSPRIQSENEPENQQMEGTE
jgi:hypothetical protein